MAVDSAVAPGKATKHREDFPHMHAHAMQDDSKNL